MCSSDLPGVGGSSGGLLTVVDDVSAQAQTVLNQLEILFDEETIRSMQGGAQHLDDLLTDLANVVADQRGALSTFTESLRRSAEGIEGAARAGPELASAIARADSSRSLGCAAPDTVKW